MTLGNIGAGMDPTHVDPYTKIRITTPAQNVGVRASKSGHPDVAVEQRVAVA